SSMIEAKLFKYNDQTEQKVLDAVLAILTPILLSKDEFFDEAYESYKLGEVLFDSMRDPMSGVILRENFRRSYFAIHDLFTRPGTFEFYLDVYKRVWGEDVDVEFVVPSPGVLQINIEALASYEEIFAAREIIDSAYVYHDVLDHEGDEIVFQTSI